MLHSVSCAREGLNNCEELVCLLHVGREGSTVGEGEAWEGKEEEEGGSERWTGPAIRPRQQCSCHIVCIPTAHNPVIARGKTTLLN